ADDRMPDRLATPFFHAAAAAAMDAPVEIYFTARSARLLAPGVAEALRASDHPKRSLDRIREAVSHGAALPASADALRARRLDAARLSAECAGRGRAVQFMARASDPRWRTLVF